MCQCQATCSASKDSIECWNCGKRGHLSRNCWSKNDNKGKGKHKKVATDAHNLDSKKPEEGTTNQKKKLVDFTCVPSMQLTKCESLNGSILELTQVQERRLEPRMSHAGRRSLVKVISFSAQQLESLSSLTNNSTLRVVTIGERISEFVVFKHRCANHCCLLVSTRRRVESQSCKVTKVTCFTKVRLLRRRSMRGSRRS